MEIEVVKLEESFLQKTQLLIDFSKLRESLSAILNLPEPCDSTEDEFDHIYTRTVIETFEKKHEGMSSLCELELRKFPFGVDTFQAFTHGVLQLCCLTELDISGNPVPKELQTDLQLWRMSSLKKLTMNNTYLQTFPPSVGGLTNLEVLSLARNYLQELPTTLRFCQNLRVLNLSKNHFKQIPGVVLHLNKLEELRRHDNSFNFGWKYFMHGPQYVRCTNPLIERENATDSELNLQILCMNTILSSQLNYWQNTTIGSLQCKILDELAVTTTICEHCNRVFTKPSYIDGGTWSSGFTVEVVLFTYLDLIGVPFLLHTCSENCLNMVKKEYGDKNILLQKEADEKYKKDVIEAQKLVNSNSVDISPEATNVPEEDICYFVPSYHWPTRRRHKCTIM